MRWRPVTIARTRFNTGCQLGEIAGYRVTGEAGDHAWGDMSYATGTKTSHAGQTDFAQFADGRVYNAYVNDADAAHGWFGKLILRERGAASADGWRLITPDAAGDGATVWHLALTSDGAGLWILYVKNDPTGDRRDDAIYLRGYHPDTGTLTDPVRIAEVTPGRTFARMTTQWRFTDDRLVVLWSETADGIAYHAHATAVRISAPK